MGMKRSKTARHSHLPKAPIIYLNDPVHGMPHARYLRDLIPGAVLAFGPSEDTDTWKGVPPISLDMVEWHVKSDEYSDRILIAGDYLADCADKTKERTAREFQEHAIKHGRNFASINLYSDQPTPASRPKEWPNNHLNLCIKDVSVQEIAGKVYRWLFTAFTAHETLHLIPESEMLATDQEAFPDYEYCPINESKYRPKDAKIQFVALVTSRPVLVDGRLQWTVADRTGNANFYFQYRGPSSQYTWDWVQSLQVGDRKALPRMPMVQIKERKTIRAAKAPIRTVGSAVAGFGVAIRSLGSGLTKLGELSKLGRSAEWVHEADVLDGKKIGWEAKQKELARRAKMEKARKQIEYKVFNEKGEKAWKDDDSIASTARDNNVVLEKEFC